MNECFVFGSNIKGIHGAGSAKWAHTYHGAIMGVGEGITGSSYAIPTKITPYVTNSLADIARAVNTFKLFAYANPDTIFKITRIGCGLAGFTDDQIAPLFKDSPSNCNLPGVWVRLFNPATLRIIVAGSRSITNSKTIYSKLDYLVSNISDKTNIEIVSGMCRGPDMIGRQWAIDNDIKYKDMPADWDGPHKRGAGMARNIDMAWYGTHLAAFYDGVSPGTKNMIYTATKSGLVVKVINIQNTV